MTDLEWRGVAVAMATRKHGDDEAVSMCLLLVGRAMKVSGLSFFLSALLLSSKIFLWRCDYFSLYAVFLFFFYFFNFFDFVKNARFSSE